MAKVYPIFQKNGKQKWPVIHGNELFMQLHDLGVSQAHALVVKAPGEHHHATFATNRELTKPGVKDNEFLSASSALTEYHLELIENVPAWKDNDEICSQLLLDVKGGYFLCFIIWSEFEHRNAYALGDARHYCTSLSCGVFYRLKSMMPERPVTVIFDGKCIKYTGNN